MLRPVILVSLGILISMMLGAAIGLWQCSKRKWCPRYLQRQLDVWRRQMAKQYAERKAGKVMRIERPAPPEGDEAA
jgi:hypothetical protein